MSKQTTSDSFTPETVARVIVEDMALALALRQERALLEPAPPPQPAPRASLYQRLGKKLTYWLMAKFEIYEDGDW